MPKLINVSKNYGDKVVLDNISVTFEKNKINGLIGCSGIGKTTILNILCGLTDFKGEVLRDFDKISYVFQNDRLLPNLTVSKNLDYVLKSVYKNKDERKKIIDEYLKTCEIIDKSNAYPNELSGGESKRVAICRAFIYPSELLIMDEPFNSLDEALKQRLSDAFIKLYNAYPRTVIFVSHGLDEVLKVCDNVTLLNKKGVENFEINMPREERDVTKIELNILKKKFIELMSEN